MRAPSPAASSAWEERVFQLPIFHSLYPAPSRPLRGIAHANQTGRIPNQPRDQDATAAEFLFPIKLHLCFFCFCSCATPFVTAVLIGIGGLSWRGASPSFRVVLVCNRSKISFSAYTIGCGRCDWRFGLGVIEISRFSDEFEVVLFPELTTGETSASGVSWVSSCDWNVGCM